MAKKLRQDALGRAISPRPLSGRGGKSPDMRYGPLMPLPGPEVSERACQSRLRRMLKAGLRREYGAELVLLVFRRCEGCGELLYAAVCKDREGKRFWFVAMPGDWCCERELGLLRDAVLKTREGKDASCLY